MNDAGDVPDARDAWRLLIKWGLFWSLMLNIPVAIFGIVATDDRGFWVAHLVVVVPILTVLVLQIPARKATDFIGADGRERPDGE